jgi:bifunctional DNA-binding transcriptional regulator/antitoxin component of YhaV-PrlF toxin-antitoxin module
MPDLLIVTQRGQVTLPLGFRKEYELKSGDRLFGEVTPEGYLIRRPKKRLFDYAGSIRVEKIDPDAEAKAIEEACAARFL